MIRQLGVRGLRPAQVGGYLLRAERSQVFDPLGSGLGADQCAAAGLPAADMHPDELEVPGVVIGLVDLDVDFGASLSLKPERSNCHQYSLGSVHTCRIRAPSGASKISLTLVPHSPSGCLTVP